MAGRHFCFRMETPAHGPARWERLAESVLTPTRIFDLKSVRFRHPVRRTERDFLVIAAPEWVNVVAHTVDDRLVMVRQFRYGINDFSLEIPGGIIEAGEDPVAAGLRELSEETGYVGRSARLIGSVHPNPAIQSNRSHFVLVEEAACVDPQAWDEDEEIAVSALPVPEVFAAARRGEISHALVLNALMFFEPIWRGRTRR